ncbi:hypothetical protein A3F66_05595 [candidate division TM6 bacterium RIFCSPHIGHO2_12_FULL_32_22]|nr:MAG: hypothetical protein A3F66_05595 [candidate division TM6 bacterium RIFCSPHIGHO2_12_FULL_32_22]
MKKILTLTLFVLQIQAINNIGATAENSVFVFDLNGVLLKLELNISWQAFKEHSGKFTLAKRLGVYGVNRKLLDSACVENKTINKGDSDKFVKDTLAVINPFNTNNEVFEIVRELHTKGYLIFGCANIGEQSLEFLRNKYPDLAKLFDECFSGFQIPRKENGFMTKGNQMAYKELRNMICRKFQKPLKYIIFVDDATDKLSIAQKAVPEFKGIRFTSAGDLRALLQKENVL